MAEILRDCAAELVAVEKDGRAARGAQSMPQPFANRSFACTGQVIQNTRPGVTPDWSGISEFL